MATGRSPIPAQRRSARGARHRWLVLPVGVALVCLAVLIAVMLGPRVCGLSLPGTMSCLAGTFDAALTAGMVGAAAVGAVVVVVGLIAPRIRRPVVIVGVTVMTTGTVVLLAVRVALFGPIDLVAGGAGS